MTAWKPRSNRALIAEYTQEFRHLKSDPNDCGWVEDKNPRLFKLLSCAWKCDCVLPTESKKMLSSSFTAFFCSHEIEILHEPSYKKEVSREH